MDHPKVCLRRGEEKSVGKTSLWIFDNQIDWYDDVCSDGCVADVVDSSMHFICRGFFNSKSKIVIRILTFCETEEIDDSFLTGKLIKANSLRLALGFENSYRAVFGDSDGLSGLTIDKYGDYISFQIGSFGWEIRKEMVISSIIKIFHPLGIMERDDIASRISEGLPLLTGVVYGTVPEEFVIVEHDAKMLVNLYEGQKTGHFLDQQENRGKISPYVKDRSVLDLCCCTGGFSVHASLYGANSVTSVDASGSALALVERNAVLNGCENIRTVQNDLFDQLIYYKESGIFFDTVILDPPAFAKSRKSLDNAFRGYKRANSLAMQITSPGGYLITFSCSKFMLPELFMKMLREAASDAGKNVRLLEHLIQSRDHSASIRTDNALYLKGEILQII